MEEKYMGVWYATIATSAILMLSGGFAAIVGSVIGIPTGVYGIVTTVKDMHNFFRR